MTPQMSKVHKRIAARQRNKARGGREFMNEARKAANATPSLSSSTDYCQKLATLTTELAEWKKCAGELLEATDRLMHTGWHGPECNGDPSSECACGLATQEAFARTAQANFNRLIEEGRSDSFSLPAMTPLNLTQAAQRIVGNLFHTTALPDDTRVLEVAAVIKEIVGPLEAENAELRASNERLHAMVSQAVEGFEESLAKVNAMLDAVEGKQTTKEITHDS